MHGLILHKVKYIWNSKTVAEKGVTYLSLTWSHNPEGRFSYDSAQMCQKGYKSWYKIYIAK